jgi:rod shape-determining protein MreC
VATYRRPRSARLLVIGLIVTSLVMITVDFRGGERGPLAAVGRGFATVLAPLQEGVAAVFRPVGSFFSSVFRAGSINAENDRLQELVQELTAQVQFVQALQAENDAFREMFGIGDRLDYRLFGATVTAASVESNFEWSIHIDKGSDDGVYQDMAVVTGAGLVGRVVQVTASSAKVLLIIDPDSRVAVRLGGSRELAVLAGAREEDLRLEFFDAEAEVEPNERVVTATYRLDGEEEGVLPPEIPVGVVSQVTPQEGGIGPQVLVRPAVDFSTLDYVALVRPVETGQRTGETAAGLVVTGLGALALLGRRRRASLD